jgi:CHASE3 domain sensor protein
MAEKTFIERLEEEELELNFKVNKLRDFIENNPAYDTVGDVQSVLLNAQLNAMKSYLSILQDRIINLLPKK